MEESSIKLNFPRIGMTLTNPSLLSDKNYSLLLNGNIQSVSDTFAFVTNELSNQLCTRFKPGFKVINVQPVISLNLTFFFLVNPTTKESEIGIVYGQINNQTSDTEIKCKECSKELKENPPLETIDQQPTCLYKTWVSAKCLNFDINFPVKSWVKVDNCNVRIYFGAKNSPIRYIDYDDYQKEKILECPVVYNNELDCDRIKIFKDACYPQISYTDIVSGGQNTAGVYQFSVAYADSNSNPITDYFYTTNPIPLGDEAIVSPTNPDYPVAKSIKLHIDNIHTDFDYINLVVLKTIAGNTTAYLVATLPVQSTSLDYVYSGIDTNLLRDVSISELLKRTARYSHPFGVSESGGYLFFYGLDEPRPLNLQPLVNNLRLKWQTVRYLEGSYKNPIIASNYTSYLRDEVYPFFIEFTRTDAPPTARFHIPAPSKSEVNQWISGNVDEVISNDDVFENSLCSDELRDKRWQVYNTASTLTPPLCSPVSDTPELITITDEQYCTGDELLMLSDGSISFIISLIIIPQILYLLI